MAIAPKEGAGWLIGVASCIVAHGPSYLAFCYFFGGGCSGLTDLVELKIDATKLSDAAMPALLDMRSLSLLHLSLCTKVTDQGLSNVGASVVRA